MWRLQLDLTHRHGRARRRQRPIWVRAFLHRLDQIKPGALAQHAAELLRRHHHHRWPAMQRHMLRPRSAGLSHQFTEAGFGDLQRPASRRRAAAALGTLNWCGNVWVQCKTGRSDQNSTLEGLTLSEGTGELPKLAKICPTRRNHPPPASITRNCSTTACFWRM